MTDQAPQPQPGISSPWNASRFSPWIDPQTGVAHFAPPGRPDPTQPAAGQPPAAFTTDPRGSALIPQPSPAAPAPNLAPTQFVDPNQIGASGGRAAEMSAYLERAMSRDQITLAEAQSIMRSEGFGEWAPDQRSDAQRAYDAAAGMTEAGPPPEAYAGRINLPDMADLDPDTALAAQGELSEIMAEFRIDPASADGFVRAIYAAQDELDRALDATARQQIIDRWEADRKAILGEDADGEQNLKAVADLFVKLRDGRNGIAQHLMSSGAIGDPRVLIPLIQKGNRLAAYRAGRPKK